jgi:hypothetical protein
MKDQEREAYEYANARPSQLHKAMVEVMKAVKNIDKSMTIGEGKMSYKGIADKDVKFVLGTAMAENGITCVPIDYDVKTRVDRWEETSNYGVKQKQSVFTEVNAKYLITHVDSGESQIIVGYGHGIDSQDKSAGKATTYALKNALLYSFLVPTGAIDDTDNTHSNDIVTPKQPVKQPLTDKQMMLPPITDEAFEKATEAIRNGKATINQVKAKYVLSTVQEKALELIEGLK